MIQIPDEIKALLHQDTCKKNIRIHFPNAERADICNDLIVKDSVSFTESLCSQDVLKFGLCEASIFECETVGVGNIEGSMIDVSCEVYCDLNVTGAIWKNDLEAYVYQVPYGRFMIDSCKRQADLNHRRIVAYGGTANINIPNEIMSSKNWPSFNTPVNYSPNIFNTVMMICGANKRLPDAQYTKLTTRTDSYIPMYSWSSFEDTYGIRAVCLGYQITNSNENKLYYAETGEMKKSIEEIDEELIESGAPSSLRQRFRYGLGKIAHKLNWCGMRDDWQKGSYIYPYQYSETYGVNGVIFVPYKLQTYRRGLSPADIEIYSECEYFDPEEAGIYVVDTSNYPNYTATYPRDIIYDRIVPNQYGYNYKNIDYISLFSSCLELSGQFANINHEGEMIITTIKQQFDLLPQTNLYPSGSLYPEGVTGGKLLPNDYRTCWYDDKYTLPFGCVKCQYVNTADADCEFIYYLAGFSSGDKEDTYQTYDFSDNEILKMYKWTQGQIQSICELIASNINGVTYMPVDFTGIGLPYVEAGDTFEILTKSNDSITTIVLNRTLTGEQTLVDSYKSV